MTRLLRSWQWKSVGRCIRQLISAVLVVPGHAASSVMRSCSLQAARADFYTPIGFFIYCAAVLEQQQQQKLAI